MTTTASKAGLKAAAVKRTAKHAQRTALPPRATEAEVQANIAEIVAESPSARYGMMTVAELKAEAKALGLVTYTLRTKGALMNAILARLATTPAQEALAEAKVDATFEKNALPVTAAVAVEENKRRKAKAKASGPVEVEEEKLDSPSGRKANAFADKAEALGWTTTLRDSQTSEDRVLCVATRGQASGAVEVISIEWMNGVFNGETCLHKTPSGRALKLRNASHALKRMELQPADVAREDSKVGVHTKTRAERRSAVSGTDSGPQSPYFAEDVSDEEVLASVAGKTITWVNGISGGLENDRIVSTSPTKIVPSHSGRAINFLGSAGFRTVRVSAIVNL